MVEEKKSNQFQLYASKGKKLITKNFVMQAANQTQFSTKSEIKDSCRGPGLLPPSPEIWSISWKEENNGLSPDLLTTGISDGNTDWPSYLTCRKYSQPSNISKIFQFSYFISSDG